MKIQRFLLSIVLILLPFSGWAFDPTPHPPRVLLLDTEVPYDGGGVRAAIVRQMRDSLQDEGFDVVETSLTFEELTPEDAAQADFLIDLTGESAHTADYGGVGIGTRHADLGLSIVGSRVVARLLVYDAATGELLGDRVLTQRTSAVLPSSIGFGSRLLYAFVGLPIAESAQRRSLARTIGHQGAAFAAGIMRGESEPAR